MTEQPIHFVSRLPKTVEWSEPPEVVESNVQEIVISLFGECNLRCVFCYDAERFDEPATVEAIHHRMDLFLEALDHITKQVLEIKVFGGELFQDKFGDEIFDAYDEFFSTIRREAEKRGKVVKLYVATNLQFRNSKRVVDLLKRHKIIVRGSYDLVGRFNHTFQIALFYTNAQLMTDLNIPFEVAFVATKPNIKAIMSNEENEERSMFDKLYEHFMIQFDFYNDVGIDGYTVTERELFEFFVYLYEHYPKISTIEDRVIHFRNRFVGYRYCNRGIWIDQIIQSACCDFKAKTSEFLSNKQCLTCPHFSYCSGSCVRVFADSKDCCVRLFFDWLEKNENNSHC